MYEFFMQETFNVIIHYIEFETFHVHFKILALGFPQKTHQSQWQQKATTEKWKCYRISYRCELKAYCF